MLGAALSGVVGQVTDFATHQSDSAELHIRDIALVADDFAEQTSDSVELHVRDVPLVAVAGDVADRAKLCRIQQPWSRVVPQSLSQWR